MVEQRPEREEFREKLTVDKQPARNKSWLPRASTLLLVSSGPFAWAATRVLGESAPDFVESVYGGAVGAAAGGALARATGWIGFSVAEWMLLGFVVVRHLLVRLAARDAEVAWT